MSRFTPVLGRIAVFGALIWTTACGEPPQVASPIPPMTIYIGDNVAIDLSEHFTDPDGDALSYSASSSAPATVAVSVAGSMLEMVPKAKGAVRVTVQAMDGNGTSPEITVSVTVGNRAPVVVDSTAAMGHVRHPDRRLSDPRLPGRPRRGRSHLRGEILERRGRHRKPGRRYPGGGGCGKGRGADYGHGDRHGGSFDDHVHSGNDRPHSGEGRAAVPLRRDGGHRMEEQ